MRKLVVLLTVLVLAAFVPALAQAAVPQPGDQGVRVAKFWIGQKVYEVNGQRFQMDVARSSRTAAPCCRSGSWATLWA